MIPSTVFYLVKYLVIYFKKSLYRDGYRSQPLIFYLVKYLVNYDSLSFKLLKCGPCFIPKFLFQRSSDIVEEIKL